MADAANPSSILDNIACTPPRPCSPVNCVAIADIPLQPDLDLTGDIEKTDTFPFEPGRVTDLYRGYVKNSTKIREQMVAIKIFRRIHIDGNIAGTIKDLYDKSTTWAKLDHPNVLPFLGFSLDLGPSPALITPYHRLGSITQHSNKALETSQERVKFVQSIAEGLSYLHSEGLVHGNLTTKKILISDAGLPVISGYGLGSISGQLSRTPSARFTAPEYYINESTQGYAIQNIPAGDVYSLSMVILEIMSGVRPYHHLDTDHSVILHILPGGRPARSDLDPVLVSDRLWGFLKHLWSHQPALRPDMNRVISALQSLQSDSDEGDGVEDEIDPSISYTAADEFAIEEVAFGHPCLSEISHQSLRGRVFRTDEYPFFNGGNSYIYRGQLMHQDGFKIHVAIKVIRVSNDGSGQLEVLERRLKRETDVWSRLNHRNLLPFLGVWDERVAPGPVLISPFYKAGDLGQYLINCSTADKEKMIMGVASGLEYLHRHEIVHGDLKVHNVLVDKHGRPCICDFGISKIVNFQGFTTSSVGTPPYMAPELFVVIGDVGGLIFERVSTTKSSDVYSFALLVLEILSTNPLKNRPIRPILTAQAYGSLRPRRDDYELALVSSDFWNLLDSCWEPDPALRPEIQDVILRLPLDTSETRILSLFINLCSLSGAAQSLRAIIHDCQKLTQNRHAAGQLSNRCHRLLLELLEQYTDDKHMKAAVDGISRCLLRILEEVDVFARQETTRIQAVLQAEKVVAVLESCHSQLSFCSMELQLNPHLNTQENIHFQLNIEKDRRDVIKYLAAIQSAQTIRQELVDAKGSDLEQLMSVMQKLLGSALFTNKPLYNDLLSTLYDLQSTSRLLLPDFHLCSGEVTRIGQFPVSGTSEMDIYEGLYLGREKVAIKVLRALNSDDQSLRRFRRECEIWKALWRVDEGKHILPFYGFCQEDGPFTYTVSPWPANGSALNYVKAHDDGIDYFKLINGIALGLGVLHSMTPPVVHGDLRATSIAIDQAGNPLISDFGLSRIIEDITGIPFTQSRGVADSYRWFAPEVCIGQGVLSLSSDIYSYGMTVLELFTHQQPYNEIKHTTEVVIRAAKGELPMRPTLPRIWERGLNDNIWSTLEACWVTKPNQRPTIHDILDSLFHN